MNILVVEDQPVNRMVMILLLKKIGYKYLREEENGQSGLDNFIQNKGLYDIILTDISMPVMDGITMTRKIREINTTIPIYAVSAFESNEFVFEYNLFTGWIMKPVNLKMLESVIHGVVKVSTDKKDFEEA